MDFNYNGNSFSNDVIVPLDSAFLLHSNKSPEFGCGVAFDGGNYKTIAVSHEFGCLEDGIATKAQLMEAYLNFFEIISPPTISINDVTVTEGDTGTNSAVFTVSLSAKFMQTVKIDYVTEESSAISDSDFIATSGTLSFPTGITTQTFTVLIVGDDKDERDETFFVNLSNHTNATLADGQGQCTIIDNDKSTLKVTYDFPLKTGGWYLISLPVIPEDSSVTALFPTALAAFGWDFKSQNYVSVTKLESNRGYWLEVPSATKNELWGKPINSYTHNYTEHQGWDLIGSVFESSSLLDEPDGSVVAVFDWDSMSQMYISIPKGQPLQPNKGYWIEVYGIPCTVTIGGTGLVSSSGIRPIRDVERKAFYTEFGSEPPPSPSFLIKDNRLVKIPRDYSLSQNFPNPFNSETIIEYTLPEACEVQLQIFNIIGEEVTKLVDKWQETGFYQIRWDGKGLSTESVPSGVYLYKFTTKKFTKIKKLLIIK